MRVSCAGFRKGIRCPRAPHRPQLRIRCRLRDHKRSERSEAACRARRIHAGICSCRARCRYHCHRTLPNATDRARLLPRHDRQRRRRSPIVAAQSQQHASSDGAVLSRRREYGSSNVDAAGSSIRSARRSARSASGFTVRVDNQQMDAARRRSTVFARGNLQPGEQPVHPLQAASRGARRHRRPRSCARLWQASASRSDSERAEPRARRGLRHVGDASATAGSPRPDTPPRWFRFRHAPATGLGFLGAEPTCSSRPASSSTDSEASRFVEPSTA